MWNIPLSPVEKREDPRGKSQASLVYTDEGNPSYPIQPKPRTSNIRPANTEPFVRDSSTSRRPVGMTSLGGGDDMAPLISHERQSRPGDVTGAGRVPEYHRPNEREYPIPTRKRSGPAESDGFVYYAGYGPDSVPQASPYVP